MLLLGEGMTESVDAYKDLNSIQYQIQWNKLREQGKCILFYGTDIQISTKKDTDSVNEYNEKHRCEFHPSFRSRWGNNEHRSMECQPF